MSRRSQTWVIADTHFGHQLMTTLRPWPTIEEHDEAIIDNWNSVVAEFDRVYVLGDLAMNRKHVSTVGRCNGKKVLVKGNHDIFKLKDYLPFFDDIRAYIVKPKHDLILSHMPIHPESLRRWNLNVHGHLHDSRMDDPDPRYKCVSLERTGYKPILLDSLL